jgi:hypothetical protein
LISTGIERLLPRGKLGTWQNENFGLLGESAGVPLLGICEYCNLQFSPVTPLGMPNKASIQEQFNAHKCKRQDLAQNALRIVREATKNK